MSIYRLALASLANRRNTVLLTIVAIALGVTLLLGVERLRGEARESFANTVSGVDLIIGARGGSMQLLLYSVFRIGNASSEMSWKSYEKIAGDPKVAWALPFALGDSHKGFRVLGTSAAYFEHFRYGQKRNLRISAGKQFSELFDAVLGADVARELGYKVGTSFTITHGVGDAAFAEHDDKPFRVVGILAKTGTPVDRTIHVGLDGIVAIHIDWRGGARVPGLWITADEARMMNLRPKTVTAVLIGLKSRRMAFKLLRQINAYSPEPLTAILPGVVLHELWRALGTVERALTVVSILVVLTSLLGMIAMLLAGIDGRRREMAILRSIGAGPRHVFALLLLEALILTALGILLGLAFLYGALAIARTSLESAIGLQISIG
ncbi:MAG: hypothetical protein CFH10_00120, partial [Alphaproteobacteria bacterium MarineAlpha4_Bin2]